MARRHRFLLAAMLGLALCGQVAAQSVATLRLGRSEVSWRGGGGGRDPIYVSGHLFSPNLDTTNTPGAAIDFAYRPGWICPLHFSPGENVASRVLTSPARISAPNAFGGRLTRAQLEGIVNGDHAVAFERKPTPEIPANPLGIWIILDFANPIGVSRVRFYPRNTVVADAEYPFQADFLRGFELWRNETQTDLQRAPDALVQRRRHNEESVVDIAVPTEYTRLLKLKSLTEVPWEVDELEVYADGFLREATYLSDIIDLGGRATFGQVHWEEEALGRQIRSAMSVHMRSGTDDTPLVFLARVLDPEVGAWTGEVRPVAGSDWLDLDRRGRAWIEDDDENWSPWKTVESGVLATAPGERRFVQYRIELQGGLFDTRQLHWLSMEYLRPPLADTLRAEVYPRRVRAEESATFRYAVVLRGARDVLGYDRLEVDANTQVSAVGSVTIAGAPVGYTVERVGEGGFALRFDRTIRQDRAVLELTFEVPIFRFGTTFSGRAYNRRFPRVPQRLEPGNVVQFAPDDVPELSGLSVAIHRSQVGQLVGEIALRSKVITPNGDGANDELEVRHNLLQVTRPTPVQLEIRDLSSRRLHQLAATEHAVGPVLHRWDGRLSNGQLVPPGIYVWVLRVHADAFEERHVGVFAVAY